MPAGEPEWWNRQQAAKIIADHPEWFAAPPTLDSERQECHRLIDQMPKEGLEETIETLKEYLEFYSKVRKPRPTPQPVVIEAKFMGTVPRAPLYIDEGE